MERFDVVVVGGGPAGASAAYWLAEAGHHVVVVEKKRFPREKTCGDGLTPRAVRQLNEMGLADRLEEYHRLEEKESGTISRIPNAKNAARRPSRPVDRSVTR